MTRFMLITLGLLVATISAHAQFVPLTSWYWQLDGNVIPTRTARIYDIDMENNTPATIKALQAAGHIVVCYFSAGTWEDFRNDASKFPPNIIGNPVRGFSDERYIDIRATVVRSIMSARLVLAASKGCDAVEPDNVDGYANNSGFPLTAAEQITYDKFIASTAHAHNLRVALKNATDLVPRLARDFDFAVVEQCLQFQECPAYLPFIEQHKAVMLAEYTAPSVAECTQARLLKFSLAFLGVALNGKKYSQC
jgi:hypothetical protein